MRPFPQEEYTRRQARIRRSMAEKGIDVLILTEANNLNYATGYACLSYPHPTFVVISGEGEDVLWVGREYTCTPAAKLTTHLDERSILSYPEHMAKHVLRDAVQRGAHDAMGFLADALITRGWGTKRIGIEYGSRLLSFPQVESLHAALPNASFADATTLVEWCRLVKSEAEIALMRQAGVIADRIMDDAMQGIAAGLRQCDVAGRIYATMLSGTPEYGGSLSEKIILTSGSYVPAMRAPFTDQGFAKDQLTNVEIGGNRLGYNVALTRSAVVGKVADDVVVLEEGVHEALAAGLDAARPGETCARIAQAFLAPLAARGIRTRSWLGYSIGIGMPFQGWFDAPVGIQLDDQTEVRPNMTFHFSPCYWSNNVNGWTMLSSETFRISESGAPELFCSSPRQVFHF